MSNETTVHVRRPGNPKKWRAKVLCEGKIADLALVTVEDDLFWIDELLDLQFVDVPELQASTSSTMGGGGGGGGGLMILPAFCLESVCALFVQQECLAALYCGNLCNITAYCSAGSAISTLSKISLCS